jgi:hypothetical protein
MQDGLPLPAEIFTIIAELLIGENNFGSLANLNVTTNLITTIQSVKGLLNNGHRASPSPMD